MNEQRNKTGCSPIGGAATALPYILVIVWVYFVFRCYVAVDRIYIIHSIDSCRGDVVYI